MKKTFYQNSANFWFGLFVYAMFGLTMIVAGVVGFYGFYGDLSVFLVLGSFALAIYDIYYLWAYLYNKVLIYEDRIFITGHKGNKRYRIQFAEEIYFSEIEKINRIFSNKNSRKETRHTFTTNDIRAYSYFEFVLKNGRKKWLCITFFSRKQRREMISIISEKTGLNLNYDKMVEEDLSYFARKKKSKEKDKKVA
ncbi:MAG: hypothetical protein E7382_05230 [Clostridiales bacterium]|nr:hypothetical protein [Clostridiales bacterium]